MLDFNYYNSVQVFFGKNTWENSLRTQLQKVGKCVMFAYGGGSIKRSGVYDRVIAILSELDKRVVEFGGIMPNPTYSKVQAGAKLCRDEKVDFVLAVGGGSVIDCVKVFCAQALIENDLWTEQFENGKKVEKALPFGSIVTASGTGAEMNDHGVITHETLKRKAGVNGGMPSFAILDPTLTLTVPMIQVLSGAFDTLSHCYESYLGIPRESTITDEINEAVMRSVINNMRIIFDNPNDLTARSELMWASAMAENGMLQIGKKACFQVHQLEHQLGAYTDCNHGQGLSALHPTLYRYIYKENPMQLARIARNVWGVDFDDDFECAKAGIDCLEQFIASVGLPTKVRQLEIDKSCFEKVAQSCNSLQTCSKILNAQDFLNILELAY